jgi:hypothetical protein
VLSDEGIAPVALGKRLTRVELKTQRRRVRPARNQLRPLFLRDRGVHLYVGDLHADRNTSKAIRRKRPPGRMSGNRERVHHLTHRVH